MKLKDQVTSLRLSKRLKALGVKQESLFAWVESVEGQEDYRVQCVDCSFEHGNNNVYSAFSVAESGEMLPEYINFNKRLQRYRFSEQGKNDMHGLFYKDLPETEVEAKTEANVRAKMIVYLIENSLMEVGE